MTDSEVKHHGGASSGVPAVVASTERYKVLFVSGKLGGVDGVSLEVDKWIHVLNSLGHEVYTAAGSYPQTVQEVLPNRQLCIPELAFDSPGQRETEAIAFPHLSKSFSYPGEEKIKLWEESIWETGFRVSQQIFDHVCREGIDLLIAQNTNAMPMTMAGGIAVYRLATEYKLATIFHHHDFWWERSRFSNNLIENLLKRTMPPADPGLEHVVISSYAAHNLRTIKRIQPEVIPNCEDFENPPVKDDYNSHFREDLGFSDDDILIVQPTRIVPRKRIEDSIRLVSCLGGKSPELKPRLRFVISLYQGDEMDERYVEEIRELAEELGVSLSMIADRVASQRGTDPEGRRLYTNRDVLVNGDLVTYLPMWEGFGNALLEAVAARVPVVVTTYLVYKTDIKGSGIDCIEIRDRYDDEGYLRIPDAALEKIHHILNDQEARERMVNTNFKYLSREFGLPVLEQKLAELLDDYGDEIRASRRRQQKNRLIFSV